MTPEQGRILGNACSERIDQLLSRLETLSGKRVIFDHDIVTDPVFGTATGQYHLSEAIPRISLAPEAAELTVAHELLHGILDHEHYPQYQPQHRKSFPFITDVVREVAHCAIHIVIDYRLHAMGYDIQAERAERAEARMAGLDRIQAEVADMQMKHWWCIRVAEELATAASFPTDTTTLAERFAAQVRQNLPDCIGLAERFTSTTHAMVVDDPLDVQQSLRRMIAAVEAEYGNYGYFKDLQRFAIIGPIFVTREQLNAPANKSVRFDVGILKKCREDVRNGTVVVVADRFSGVTWGVATSESLEDKKIAIALEELAKDPLEKLLRHCQVKFVER